MESSCPVLHLNNAEIWTPTELTTCQAAHSYADRSRISGTEDWLKSGEKQRWALFDPMPHQRDFLIEFTAFTP